MNSTFAFSKARLTTLKGRAALNGTDLERAGKLNEAALAAFCADNKFEETVVALAMMTKVPVNVADRLVGGDRSDPVLILRRAIGLN